MKTLLALILLAVISLFGIASASPDPVEPVQAQQEEVRCPEGTYLIDYTEGNEPVCKQEPTGCPYGDSIPVDSPKCVAPDEVKSTTPTPVETQENEIYQGK